MQKIRVENLPKYIVHTVILLLVQIMILDRISILFALPAIHIYILLIFMLPTNTNRMFLLTVAFLLGLVVDNFNHTLGVNAATACFVAYVRPLFFRLLHLDNLKSTNLGLSIRNIGFSKVLRYCFISLVVHFVFFYFFEAFSAQNFFYLIAKAFISASLSFIFVILYYVLFNKR